MLEEFCKVCGLQPQICHLAFKPALARGNCTQTGCTSLSYIQSGNGKDFGKGVGGLGVSVLPTSEGRPCTLVALDKATLRADPTVRGSAPGHQRPSDGSAPEGNQAHRETPTLWHHSARIATKADDPD